MRPKSEIGLTMDDLQAELDGLRGEYRHHLEIALTAEQKEALRFARPGKKGGVKWYIFIGWWKAKGWPGSETTLRRKYRQLEAEG